MNAADPKFVDVDYARLLALAHERLRAECPEWTDLGPSDPGETLLELFAYVSDLLAYKVNRLPERVHVELLKLLGVAPRPAHAARVTLEFTLPQPAAADVRVPRWTRVAAAKEAGKPAQNGSAASAGPTTFHTLDEATIRKGERSARVDATHGELVRGELLGVGDGRFGQTFRLRRVPAAVGSVPDSFDLRVAVAVTDDRPPDRAREVEHNGVRLRAWERAESFLKPHGESTVARERFVADPTTGLVAFAPEYAKDALDAVPAAGAEVRAWYRVGGGDRGNVPAGALTKLVDPPPPGAAGMTVTNPERAAGGLAAQTLDDARRAAHRALRTLDRAVTADDYVALARERYAGLVARALARAQREAWRHAPHGTVELTLVPRVPDAQRVDGRVPPEVVDQQQGRAERGDDGGPSLLAELRTDLARRSPLGTTLDVRWARLKRVTVRASLSVASSELVVPTRDRLVRELNARISPLGDARHADWPFGRTLYASQLYEAFLREPGVTRVASARFVLDDAPGEARVACLAADPVHPNVFYAGVDEGKGEGALYRSANAGDGWELLARWPGEVPALVAPHPTRAGLLAVVTQRSGGAVFRFSRACGEQFGDRPTLPVEGVVRDVAWDAAVPGQLWVARGDGLGWLQEADDKLSVRNVLPKLDKHDAWAVACALDDRRRSVVAVAFDDGGTLLAVDGGRVATSFVPVGLVGQKVRALALTPTQLLAGVVVVGGGGAGGGVRSLSLGDQPGPNAAWLNQANGWTGGSCDCLALAPGGRVFAGTFEAGVLRASILENAQWPAWAGAPREAGLPASKDGSRLAPVTSLAPAPPPFEDGDQPRDVVLAGGDFGLYRCADPSALRPWHAVGRRELDEVTLPADGLPVSGDHALEVASDA